MKDFLTCAFAALSCMVLAERAAFVESTGNQHFDTGVVPNATTRVVADVQYVVAPGSGVAVNGWQAKDSQEVFVFGINGGKFQTGVGDNNQWQNSNVAADTARHVFDIQSGSQKLDGTSIGTGTISNKAEAGQTITFFARHGEWITPAQIGNWIQMRLFGCQIYSGATLVRDYVPWCEKGVFGLYDRVNGTFAGPTAGSPLNGVAYERLDYVESTGREFLDTGYVPNPKTHLVADVQYLAVNKSMMYNGWQASGKQEVFYFGVTSNDKFMVMLGDTESNAMVEFATADTKRCVFDLQSGSQKFGKVGHGTTNLAEVATKTFTKTGLAAWKTFYLFARHGEWHAQPYRVNNYFKMRFYGMRIFEDEVLVHDFVPAARNGVAGILDVVTGDFKAALRGTLRASGIAISERDYIDATGAQYIDTGIEPTANTRIVADVQFNSISANQLMGWAGDKTEALLFGAKGNPKTLAGCVVPNGYWSIFDATNGTAAVANDFQRHVWDLRSGSQKLDGVELACADLGTGTIGSTASPGQSLYIFARHAEWLTNEGQLSDLCNARLYSFRIYEGATLVRDYVPCTGNGVAGLYDRVSKAFFASASSARCVAPAASAAYDELHYVEADGRQYLDTGVVAKPSVRVVADLRFRKFGLGNQMMGWAASNPEEGLLFGVYTDGSFGGYFRQNYSSPWPSSFAADTGRHVFDFRNGSQKVDDVEIGTDAMQGPLCPVGTLELFGRHREWNAAVDWLCHARMYGCQIYDGETLVRDYVPAKVDGRACLYDRVNQRACFSESGTDFLAGENSDQGLILTIR